MSTVADTHIHTIPWRGTLREPRRPFAPSLVGEDAAAALPTDSVQPQVLQVDSERRQPVELWSLGDFEQEQPPALGHQVL